MRGGGVRVAIGLAMLGGVWWFYSQTNSIVTTEHERFELAIEQIRRLNSTLDQDVLRVRFGLLDDYDSFGEHGNEISQSLQDLHPVPAFVGAKARAQVDAKVEDLTTLLREKADAIESFKSANAVLKNSLHYLPLAASEFVHRLQGEGGHRDLEDLFNDLMGHLLAFSVAKGPEPELEIQTILSRIDVWRKSHPRDRESALVTSLIAHVLGILKHEPAVDALVEQLLTPTVGQAAAEVSRLYETEFRQAVRSVEQFRVLLYSLCALLLLGIASSLWALRTTNRRLEKRTLALAHNNQELQQLLEVSRRSGMAEVAIDVLHNVGNTLNSVNVSAGLIADGMRRSRSGSLIRVVALLDEHRGRLAEYIAEDPAGKAIPAFLTELSASWLAEQRATQTELESMQGHIDRIKEVVAMQQRHAEGAAQ